MTQSNLSTLAVLSIASFRIAELQNEIAKINRKAAKFGNGGLELSAGEVYLKKIELDSGKKINIEYQDVIISGNLPIISGWTIVAVIDHMNESAIVHSYSEIPGHYRNRGSFCDHCNSMRRRNKTIILQKDSEFKQVGSTCLKDYLNRDIIQELGYLNSVNRLLDMYEGDVDFLSGGNYRMISVFEVREVIAASIRIIDRFGFIKTSDENFELGKMSTRTRLIDVIDPPNKGVKAYYDTELPVIADLDSKIDNVLSWLNDQSDNEFILNLKSIVSFSGLKFKHFGYIAGLVAAYNKSVGDSKKEIEYSDSYVGNIKDRIDFQVKLIKVLKIDSYYGVTYLHSFIDNTGHSIVWFGSKDCGYAIGDEFKMKATIKDHKEYNGIKQTVVTRASF